MKKFDPSLPSTPRPGHTLPSTVSSGFVNGLLAGVRRHGLEPAELLKCAEIANISHSGLRRFAETASRVPVARYAALYRMVSDVLDDEGFGLFSRPLRSGHFEFLGRATLSATHLQDALQRMGRYLRITLDELAVSLTRDGDMAVLRIEQAAPLPVDEAGRVFAHEWLLRMIHGLAAWLVAHPLPLHEVGFPYPAPPHAGDYELVFAPRAHFSCPRLEARFPAAWLTLPVRRDEAALTAYLVSAPASITTLYRRDRMLALQVREHLRASLPDQPDLIATARRLHVSPRTLHRRLEAEGTHFRQIREALRRDLAIEWLGTTQRPIQQIAGDLGFADAASFYRAFVAWTGRGPRAFRAADRENAAL